MNVKIAYLSYFAPLLLAASIAEAQMCGGLAVTITGTAGADNIIGTFGADVIDGLGGNDRIEGLEGADVICGGDGDDDLLGGNGDDLLFGDAGNDVMEGNNGNDACNGVTGIDSAALDCEVYSNVDTKVYAVTLRADDGTALDGALYVPTGDAAAQGTRQVAMIVSHGAMGSFASSVPKIIGLQAAPLGFTVLALNRRDWGEDGGGGAVLFKETTLDVGVGVDFLAGLGYESIYVAGHSQGTQNAAIYPSLAMDDRVAAVGLYGTVDDGRTTAINLLFRDTYKQDVTRARQLIADGLGDIIIGWPTFFLVDLFRSPANYLSFWGPDSLSVVVQEIPKLTVPALLMRADGDGFTPDQMSLNVMAAANAAGVDATYIILDYPFPLTDTGGNAHGFVGVERELIQTTLDWLTVKLTETETYTVTTKLSTLNPPGNIEPVASAGGDQAVTGMGLITLNGSGSIDLDGSIVSTFWTQLSGASVILSDPAVAQPSFTPPPPDRDALFGIPPPQTLRFEVTVTDDDGGTDSNQVEITVSQDKFIETSQSSSLGPIILLVLFGLLTMRRRRIIG
ncbi:MAG: hypothetical protein QGG54_07880 [Gammaproteobacteria bacterium]|jgi:pimeloyl-ACP methyl ester carboxylesterase|nr:hypothetical protein [Chromatiales bacterium]MDP6414929.1 hypothetical protein [Gammaproteobacteria bacterium]MDP6673826.1 hypothetical protein [Gammaproteobacteria bacterium]